MSDYKLQCPNPNIEPQPASRGNPACGIEVGFNAVDNFVAMRLIKRGKELCWDYGFAETNPKFRMKCRCGTAVCAHVPERPRIVGVARHPNHLGAIEVDVDQRPAADRTHPARRRDLATSAAHRWGTHGRVTCIESTCPCRRVRRRDVPRTSGTRRCNYHPGGG